MSKKVEIEWGWIPEARFIANCTHCHRGYTAKERSGAGHHCICGKKMLWNDLDMPKAKPNFMSYKKPCLGVAG